MNTLYYKKHILITFLITIFTNNSIQKKTFFKKLIFSTFQMIKKKKYIDQTSICLRACNNCVLSIFLFAIGLTSLFLQGNSLIAPLKTFLPSQMARLMAYGCIFFAIGPLPSEGILAELPFVK